MTHKLVRIKDLEYLKNSEVIVNAMYKYAGTIQQLEFNPRNRDKHKGVIPGTRYNWWPEHYEEVSQGVELTSNLEKEKPYGEEKEVEKAKETNTNPTTEQTAQDEERL